MIVGVQAIPACFDLDQHRASCPTVAVEVHLQAYDSLLRHPIRADSGGYRSEDVGVLQPWLAQTWEMSADGRTCSLELRRGVKSANGNEMTAHDVKWSWDRAFALGAWSARAARLSGLASPNAVRAVQTHLLEFRLESPNERFPGLLAGPLPPIYDLEEVRRHCPVGDPWGLEWLRSHAAGFGPYTLASALPGEAGEAVLMGNAAYWQAPVRARKVLLRAVPSPRARAEALTRGSIDLAADLPANEAQALARRPGVKVESFGAGRQVVLRIDPRFAPFDQPLVRQALRLAMPYQEMARQVFPGALSRPAPVGEDQRAARDLLRQAGYPSGFRMSLSFPRGVPDIDAMARVIQIETMRLGLKMVLEPMQPAAFEREKLARQLPAYVEDRRSLSAIVAAEELDPLPSVEALVLVRPRDHFAARAGLTGFIRRSDGRPRYVEFHGT